MFKSVKTTVRIDLTDTEDLARYDDILNNDMCTILSELIEQRTETEHVQSGDDEGESRQIVKKFPFKIVTYETLELV